MLKKNNRINGNRYYISCCNNCFIYFCYISFNVQVYKISANIYLTETLEKIGIANYDDVVEGNQNLLPTDLPEIFNETITVENLKDNEEYNFAEDVIKKVTVKISYQVNGKNYEQSISRLKQKE